MTPPLTRFGAVVHLNTDRIADPLAAGVERYVGLEHITREDLRIHSWGQVAEGTTFTNAFKPGQVLFGKRRAYQRKVAVADFAGVCSSDIYVFEPKDPQVLLPDLLPFICQTEGFFQHAVGTSAGSLSPRTNWGQLADYEFPLPPLDEQRRIARLLWAVEEVVRKKLDLSSRLSTVMDSIREETFFAANTPTIKLSDVCEIRYGLGQPPPKRETGIPLIRATNISKGKISKKDLLLTNPGDLPKNRAIYLSEGDIILVRSGAYTGDSAMITGEWVNSIAGYDLVLSPDKDRIHPVFLAEFLLHKRTIRTILTPLSARSAQPHINAVQVSNIEIVLPPIDVQLETVEKFNRMNQTLSELQDNIEILKRTKTLLLEFSLS